jgi:pheromone shutdown-related protein TraB
MELTSTRDYPEDVKILQLDGREFIIVGTAHISQQSADLVRQVISQEQPDIVCVELDEARYKTLVERSKWEALNLREVIRQKQLTTLMVNLILAAYQKRLGAKLGILPGAELLEATKVAKELNIPIALCDRDVRITLRRAWYSMSLWERAKLMSVGLASVFESPEISEEMLTEIREKDVLSELMRELGNFMPVLKTVLLDERDTYISQKMRQAQGQKIVSVVGAGHVEGITQALTANQQRNLAEIEQVPPMSPWVNIFGWGISLLVLVAISYIGWEKGLTAMGENIQLWVLVHSIPSALGALIAFGHPLTILTAFLVSPITALIPVIGVGHVAAFVQVYFQPPVVRELHDVTDEVMQWRKWWQNKVLRIFLVFLLTTVGGSLGTYVGIYGIFSNLVK